MALKKAFLKDADLLEQVKKSHHKEGDFQLWWLGQSGFLVQYEGHHLLIDPYLSDSLTIKYQQSDKPHIRITERVIDPELLDFIDVVTSSHNHTDHLDAETLKPIVENNHHCQLVIPEANRSFVCDRLNCPTEYPLGLRQGDQLNVDPFTIHAIPAAHNDLVKDASGNCCFLGYVFKFGPWTLYHSGDTLWYDSLVSWLKPFDIDVALLPINGDRPERKVAGNLNAEQAALLGKSVAARLVIPCHYDMFTFNTADPQDFADHCDAIDQPHRVLGHGEMWSSRQWQR